MRVVKCAPLLLDAVCAHPYQPPTRKGRILSSSRPPCASNGTSAPNSVVLAVLKKTKPLRRLADCPSKPASKEERTVNCRVIRVRAILTYSRRCHSKGWPSWLKTTRSIRLYLKLREEREGQGMQNLDPGARQITTSGLPLTKGLFSSS